jgi:N-acetylneuraminic acid mutarotase
MAACAIGSDIYVSGGTTGGQAQATVFKFDTKANEWSNLAPMPIPSFGHGAHVLDGLVYVVGAGGPGREILRFDPASGAWSTMAPTVSIRKCGASFVVGGSLYVAGGFSSKKSVERYNVASNTWTDVAAVADMLEERMHFGAVTTESAGPVFEEQDLFDSLIAKA